MGLKFQLLFRVFTTVWCTKASSLWRSKGLYNAPIPALVSNKGSTLHYFSTSHTSMLLMHTHEVANDQEHILTDHSFSPLPCAECDDSLQFSGASSIPLCYIPFPSTLFHQLVFHPLSRHLAIYFLVYLSVFLFPNSYIILFLGIFCLPFSVHAHTSVMYVTLLSLL